MSLYRKEIEVFPSFSSAVEVFCPFFRRRVCSLKVTSLPFELVVLFFVQGSREILLMFLLLLFTLSCTMEELASQLNKLSLSEKETDGFVLSKEQCSGEFLSTPFMTHGKEGIYVPGFYEYKQTFKRKAFYSARMESEGIEIEAGEGRSENVQVSRETKGVSIINEGVSHVNDETVMRETLHTYSTIPTN